MAEETTAESPDQADKELEAKFTAHRERFAAQSWYEIDTRLDLLLSTVFFGAPEQHANNSIGLTVLVDGALISGLVVSEEAWAKRQRDDIATSSEFVASVLGRLEERLAENKARNEEAAKANPLLMKPNQFIHFIGPVLVTGNNHVQLQPTRVDLRKVTGWSVDQIVPN